MISSTSSSYSLSFLQNLFNKIGLNKQTSIVQSVNKSYTQQKRREKLAEEKKKENIQHNNANEDVKIDIEMEIN